MPKPHPRLYRKRDASGKEVGPWYAVIYDRGMRRRICTKRTDVRAAELELRRLEREASDERPAIAANRHTVNEALDELIKVNGQNSNHYQMREPPLRLHLGQNDVNALHVDHLHAYIAKRLETPIKNAPQRKISRATVLKELKALKTALRLAAKRGFLKQPIESFWPDFEAPYVPRKRHLSPAQFNLLANHLPRARLTWIVVGAFTGGRRRTEVERLAWEDVRFDEDEIDLRGTKTADAARTIPLSAPLKTYLLKLRDELGGEPRGRIVVPWHNQWRDLGEACEAVGIPRVTANDVRRTFASWMIQAGVSNSQVAKLLGHTTTVMVDRTYGKHTVPALRSAVATLPAPILTLPVSEPGADPVH